MTSTSASKGTSETRWVKSGRSNQDSCVELAWAPDGETVLLRDSKDPNGPSLRFRPDEIDAMVLGAADGDFNQFTKPRETADTTA